MSNKRDERIGIKITNNQGLVAEVVEYKNYKETLVRFDDGTLVTTRWDRFISGLFRNPNIPFDKSLKNDRIGEIAINHQGSHMKIIEYTNAENIVIQFEDNPKHIIRSRYDAFKLGKTNNPFIPTVYGVGITGNIPTHCKDKEYQAWHGILERCYSDNQRRKSWKYYKDCSVSKEFLYYPNFAEWVRSQENYEEWKHNTNFHVDKDILYKGNKEYSPEKCCLVPSQVNNLIRSVRGNNRYPGVRQIRQSNKYSAVCGNIYIGTFDDEYKAFLAYKKYKEEKIKETAEKEYRNGTITKKCRDALIKYEIEETD